MNTVNNIIPEKDALFKLKIIPPIGAKLTKLEVKFEEPEGLDLFCCKIAVKSYTGYLSTEDISKDEAVKKLAPLFRYWIAEGQTVTLEGSGARDQFFVNSAACSQIGSTATALMVQRLLGADAADARAVDALDGEKLIRTEDEMKTFFQICRHTLPKNLQQWMRNEIGELESTASVTQKRQAISLMSKVASIDWSPKKLNLPPTAEVRKILDAELYGMEEAKQRVLELVAFIRRSEGVIPPQGLLLVGCPGVGKTHLLKVLATVLGLPFTELNFSTTEPESIKGSSRVYENARESALFRAFYAARSATVVLYVEEVDKAIQTSIHNNNPTETLLAILSHDGFFENMLEPTIPCAGVLSVCTANDPTVLTEQFRRRLLEVNVPGYSPDEKRAIWDSYIFPKQLASGRVSSFELQLTPDAKELIFSSYALSPGARDLNTIAQRLVGNYAVSVEEGRSHHLYTAEDLVALLGPARKAERRLPMLPGMAKAAYILNGNVRTALIEVSVRDGEGTFSTPGIFSVYQREYLRAAYEAFCAACLEDLSDINITVFSPDPVAEAQTNYLTAAAVCAMWSAVTGIPLNHQAIAFFGGVDVLGNLYSDISESVVPLLNALACHGVKTLYTPPGIDALLHGKLSDKCNIEIIETPSIETMLTLLRR